MPPNNKESSQPTPEEVANIEKKRTLSDATLLENGAEYRGDAELKKKLVATDRQVRDAKGEMEGQGIGLNPKEKKKWDRIQQMLEVRNIKIGDHVTLYASYSHQPNTIKRSGIFEGINWPDLLIRFDDEGLKRISCYDPGEIDIKKF